jgi:tetratricopeptide (TPR) repeat protein
MVCIDSRSVCVEVRYAARFPSRVALVLVALLTTHRAWAQEEWATSPDYEREVGAGITEHEAGRFESAREHFMHAHAVFPNARTLRGLGKVEFELGNYVPALQYLEAALSSEARPLPADLRDEVSRLIEQTRAFVGELTVELQPESARLTVDGVTQTSGPHARLVLATGQHVLEARASGRLSERRQVEVRARENQQLAIELRTPEPTEPLAPTLALPVKRATPTRRRWWAWTVGGAALAGAVTAAVLLTTRDRDTHTRSVPPGAQWDVGNR